MADVSVFARRRVVSEASGLIGDVVVFASSAAAGDPCGLVQDRRAGHAWVSECLPGSFVQFDFQRDPVVVCGYALAFPRLQGAPPLPPRAVLLEASNDAQAWVALDRRAFASPAERAVGAVPAASRCVARFIRISQPDRNFSDTHSFALAELDLRSLAYTAIERGA